MKSALAAFDHLALTFLAAFLTSTAAANAQFPPFPPSNVTSVQDRDQMMWQLGLSYPALPSKLQDTNAPPNTRPANASNPEGNWTDAAGHTITRSGHGLWNNYDDASAGFFPGPESLRTGAYTPLDLLKMRDGSRITTPEQWRAMRRLEVLKDVQEQGLIMPDAKPGVDVGYISGDIGFRYRNGGHTDAPDWPAFFQFATLKVCNQ